MTRWWPHIGLALALAASGGGVVRSRGRSPSVSHVVTTVPAGKHQDVVFSDRPCRLVKMGVDVITPSAGGVSTVTVQASDDGTPLCTYALSCGALEGFETEVACDAITPNDRMRVDIDGTCSGGSQPDVDVAFVVECA